MGIPWKQWSDIAVLFCAVVTSLVLWPSSLGLSGDNEKDTYANFFEEILPSDGRLSGAAGFSLNDTDSYFLIWRGQRDRFSWGPHDRARWRRPDEVQRRSPGYAVWILQSKLRVR